MSRCTTCALATPITATEIGGHGQKTVTVLRCDWSPPGETPRWFAAGMMLCETRGPRADEPCDAWMGRG